MTNETSSPSAAPATTEPNTHKPSLKPSSASSVIDFRPIVRAMETGDMTPKEISDGRARISAELARMYWRYGRLAAQRAKFVVNSKGSYKTMAETERVWEATENGQIDTQLKYEIKGLEALLDGLETMWFNVQNEAKNIY